jgi:hypothetical protein
MTVHLRILPPFGLAASLLVSHGPFILLSLAVALGLTARPARADILYISAEARGLDIDKIISDGTVSAFSSLLPSSVYPAGLAFDVSRNLYATDPNEGQIDKISPSGTVSLFATVPSFPYGLAFDTSGNLYVAGLFTDEINKITPGGDVSLFATLPTESGPNGLAFDASGNLYVTMDSMDQISRITSSGSVSVFARLPSGSSPRGLAFDGSGNLYAADCFTDQISKITAGGDVSLFATLPTESGPHGLAFDTSGNLYAAGLSGEIEKIATDGTVNHFATTTVPSLFIAMTDDAGNPLLLPPAGVPEPATMTLLLMGFVIAGLSFQRRSPRNRHDRELTTPEELLPCVA